MPLMKIMNAMAEMTAEMMQNTMKVTIKPLLLVLEEVMPNDPANTNRSPPHMPDPPEPPEPATIMPMTLKRRSKAPTMI